MYLFMIILFKIPKVMEMFQFYYENKQLMKLICNLSFKFITIQYIVMY